MNPEISIIIPVYNVEKYIDQCLDSVKQQSFKNFEVIIVDDGSPDNSYTIYERYVQQDKRFRFIKKENGGVSKARNTGLEAALGKYVIFIDSDDWLPLNALEILYDNAIKADSDLTIGDVVIAYDSGKKEYVHIFEKDFDTDSKEFIKEYKKSIMGYVYNPFPYGAQCNMATGLGGPWNKLIKRELLINNGLEYDPYVKGIFDDCLFTLNLLKHVRNICYISKSVYFYRIISSSLIHRYRSNALDISGRIFERLKEYIDKEDKSEEFVKPFSFYVVRRFDETLGNYFFATDNKQSLSARLKNLRKIISSEPYKTAFCEVEQDKLHKSRKAICRYAMTGNALGIWLVYTLKQFKMKFR